MSKASNHRYPYLRGVAYIYADGRFVVDGLPPAHFALPPTDDGTAVVMSSHLYYALPEGLRVRISSSVRTGHDGSTAPRYTVLTRKAGRDSLLKGVAICSSIDEATQRASESGATEIIFLGKNLLGDLLDGEMLDHLEVHVLPTPDGTAAPSSADQYFEELISPYQYWPNMCLSRTDRSGPEEVHQYQMT